MALFYAGLAGTALTLLLILFGAHEGAGSLIVGLVAYGNLMYHLVAGPALLFWFWRKKKRHNLKSLSIVFYFLVIYTIGLYAYIITSGLDDAATEKMAEISEPDSYQLRELGYQLWVSASSGKPVHRAVTARIERLIPTAESLNSRTKKYLPAIWYLAGIGEEAATRSLIEHGAVLDDPQLFTTSPLYHATVQGHASIVQLLLEAGADPDAVDHRGIPALVVAIDDQNLPIVEALVAAQADLELSNGEGTAFARAVGNGRSDLVELLLKSGAEPVMPNLRMPIERAVEQEDQAMVDILSKYTAGFEAQSENREAILFQLINRCELAKFEYCLDQGADPDVKTFKNDRLLARIIALETRMCGFDEVRSQFSRAVLDAGGDPNLPNARGDSPLLDALARQRPEIARQLVQAGASVEGALSSGVGDVLILAARAGLNDVVDQALANGFEINHRWQSGLINTNALLAAVSTGHTATVTHLIERGARLPDDFLGDVLVHNCFLQAAKTPAILEILVSQYLAGTRNRREEKMMRHWVGGTDNADDALAVLDRMGIE